MESTIILINSIRILPAVDQNNCRMKPENYLLFMLKVFFKNIIYKAFFLYVDFHEKILFFQGVAGGTRKIHTDSVRQNQFDAKTH